MGKSFKKELLQLNETYTWAKSVDINISSDDLDQLMASPTFVVGSGGSYSACHMFSAYQANSDILKLYIG